MSRKMKDSGVEWIGKIPEGWNVMLLKRLSEIQTGSSPDKKEGNNNYSNVNGIPWIKAENLGKFSPIRSTTEYLTENGCRSGRLYPPYTVYVCCIASIGKVGFSDVECSCNQQINGLSFNNTVNWKFGFYETIASAIEHIARSNKSVTPILNATEEGNIKFAISSLTEQQQIVHFLDRKCTAIDIAIEKTKKSIEKLEEYKKAVITKAVTKGIDPNVKMKDSGVEWIGEIPENWDVTKTKYLFRILKRIAGQEGFDVISITQKGLKIKDIKSNEGQIAENYSNYQFVFPGDFAMNHMDLLTGWVDLSILFGVTSPDYRVFHKINETSNDDYYKYVFQSLYFNKIYYGLAQGVAEVGRKRLQAPAFKELKLPCPPDNEQAKIATDIKNKCIAIDALIAKKQNAIEKWEEYKKSLIYYAVTGKIDCRNEVIE